MDNAIVVITYFCAILGSILLLLGCILVALFLYDSCKKRCSSTEDRNIQYVQVDDDEEKGSFILKKEKPRETQISVYDVLEKNATPPTSLEFDGIKIGQKRLWKRNTAPEKVFWKKLKEPLEKIEFSDEDFEVPKEKPRKSKIVRFRQTKSEWNINDLKVIEEDKTSFISPSTKQSLKDGVDYKSQYFDALDEVVEENEISNTDEWIDIEEIEDIDENEIIKCIVPPSITFQERKQKLLENPAVRRRIRSLRKLHREAKNVDTEFYKDLHRLEMDYNSRYSENGITAQRRKLISEIPDYWYRSLENCDTLKAIIQTHDVPVLSYLSWIEVTPYAQNERFGFLVEFTFRSNDYFSNSTLTKDYELKTGTDGPEIAGCTGTRIFWNKGKNATLKPVRKVQPDGEIVIKWAKRNSFFNFFTPPKETGNDAKKVLLLEAHYELGLFLKETFVPKSLSFYLGLPDTRSAKITKEIKMKTLYNKKNRDHAESNKNKSGNVGNNVNHYKGMANNNNNNNTILSKERKVSSRRIENSYHQPDYVRGTFRLISSEGFDEFMKRLGVGMIKRKLGNSMTPVVHVQSDEKGTYTITTETRVKTTISKFKLNETFEEENLDGRITYNTVTREGNKLTIYQEGDPSRNEISSKMIREFEEDKMTMKLYVDELVCTRIYARIK